MLSNLVETFRKNFTATAPVVFLALMVCSVQAAYSATYYINGQTGDDSWDGQSETPGGNGSGPWRTLLKLNGYPLDAGDTVIVEDGVYDLFSQTGSVSNPQIDINGNGSAGNPIVIKARNKHGAVIDANSKGGGSIGASEGHRYLVWDGFRLVNHYNSGAKVKGLGAGATNIVFRNLWIDGVTRAAGEGLDGENTIGIFIRDCSGCVVENSWIRGVENPAGGHNAAAIMLYKNVDTLVQNNLIEDNLNGFFDKNSGSTNKGKSLTVRYNIFRNNSTHKAKFGGEQQAGSDNHIYQNVFINTQPNVEYGESGKFYNNIVHLTSEIGTHFLRSDSNPNGLRSTNNIFIRDFAPSGAWNGALVAYNGPGTDFRVSDRNVFSGGGNNPLFYSPQIGSIALAQWRSQYSLDPNSIVLPSGTTANGLFQAPGSLDYRPKPGMPGATLGRYESWMKDGGSFIGLGPGQTIGAGPYITGNELIGPGQLIAPPKSPQQQPIQ